jgi:hypothetical protein
MAVSSAGLRLKCDCSGEAQKQFNSKLQTRFLVREDALIAKRRNCQTKEEEQDKIWSRVPKWGTIPRRTGRLTVGRKKTSKLQTRPPLRSSGQGSRLQNGDVLCFLWGTNWIYICYVEESSPPLWSSGQGSWLQNGDVLCLLWGTNWIYICYVEESRPPLWSSGQSSWLHNGVVLCFLWGTNWIYICYVEESRAPLWSSGQSSWLQDGDVLCFLWGTNWIYICSVEESRPPLWSSGQSSCLQIRGLGSIPGATRFSEK